MSEVFISHSTKDHQLALELKERLEAKGTTAFLAPCSIAPGAKWSSEILSALRKCKIMLFLASRDACESRYVNQELGGSLAMEKPLVPILCGVSPEELPGWTKELQAVELSEDRTAVRKLLDSIAETLSTRRFWNVVVALLALWFFVWLIRRT
jgi:hypothetical protein